MADLDINHNSRYETLIRYLLVSALFIRKSIC